MSQFRRAGALLNVSPAQDDRRLRKAIQSSSAPEIIVPQEADRLIDLIVDQSTLWPEASVVPMNTNKKRVRFLDLLGGVLRPRSCGNTYDTVHISGSVCELSTVELVAQVPICDDVLEDNIEHASLEAHVLDIVTKEISNELEVWALMANTDGTYVRPDIVANETMALIDGWYQQMRDGAHVLDAADATDTAGRAIHACKLADAMKTLPTKWRRNRASLRYGMPSDMLEDWNTTLAARSTPLGDQVITGSVPARWGQTPFFDIPLLPTDMHRCVEGSIGNPNGTFFFLGDLANLVLGIERRITYEREREGKAGRTWHIWTLRADAKICIPDALVLYDCMSIGSCNDLYCQAAACA